QHSLVVIRTLQCILRRLRRAWEKPRALERRPGDMQLAPMNFLTPPLVQLALHHFDHIESTAPDWVTRGDWFFSTFGPGNAIYATDRPHERFSDYEVLLKLLQNRDSAKYEAI